MQFSPFTPVAHYARVYKCSPHRLVHLPARTLVSFANPFLWLTCIPPAVCRVRIVRPASPYPHPALVPFILQQHSLHFTHSRPTNASSFVHCGLLFFWHQPDLARLPKKPPRPQGFIPAARAALQAHQPRRRPVFVLRSIFMFRASPLV